MSVRVASFLLVLLLASPLVASDLLVAFRTDTDGGVARIELDATGALSPPVTLFRHPALAEAAKLRVSPDSRHATLNVAQDGRENFAIIDLAAAPGSQSAARLLSLGFAPEEHRLSVREAFVGGTDGHLVALELTTGAVARRWNTRERLSPPGHKPEDMLLLADENLLLVSLQKDGKKGRLGHRVAVLRASDFSLVGDLPLPRDHAALHLSEKESGPSPEVLRADPATNTLLVTLDLYGALGFADLDAALAGRLENFTAISTAPDGAWGRAFPDRLTLARVADRSLAIVSNASATAGGLAVFDVAARRRLAFFPTESGCAEPVLIEGGRRLATIVSGKQKRVVAGALENTLAPGRELLLLDLARAAEADPAALVRAPLDGLVGQIAAPPAHPQLVAVTLLAPPRLVLCSVVDGHVLATVELSGRPVALADVR